MLSRAHAIIYSADAGADRAFFRGGLPPAELGVHPGENGRHELYLMEEER